MPARVNLVPADCLQRRERRRRRNLWAALALGLAGLLAGAWSISGTAHNAVNRVGVALRDAQRRHQALAGALSEAQARRSALLERLELLARLRHPQPWAGRLAGLTAQTPAGIVLTALAVEPQAVRSALRGPGGGEPAGAARPSGRGLKARRVAGGAGLRRVRIKGVARDHEELTRFIGMLQRGGQWGQVELTRAEREPFLGRLAVSFELLCRCGKEKP